MRKLEEIQKDIKDIIGPCTVGHDGKYPFFKICGVKFRSTLFGEGKLLTLLREVDALFTLN